MGAELARSLCIHFKMRNITCCGLKNWTLGICSLYTIIHIGLLVLNVFILENPENHVDNFIHLIDTNDNRLYRSEIHLRTRQYLIQNSGEYLALPITVNVVLLASNILAFFGAICTSPLILVPWILAYFVYILFCLALMVYLIFLLEEVWFKVILFLVVAPLIVVAASFWIVVVRLLIQFRQKGKIAKKTMGVPVPATVYTPEPHNWDTPLPIWALQPPTSAWDPTYLQQIDPRYVETPEESRRSVSRSRRTSRSQSKSDDSQAPSDSMSLSEKYGSGLYDRPASSSRYDQPSSSSSRRHVDYNSREEDNYSDESDPRTIREFSELGTRGEIEVISEERTDEYTTDTDNDQSRRATYSRPKSRAESVVSLSDKYAPVSEKYSNYGEQEEILVNFHKQ